MTISRQFTKHSGLTVPEILGAGGGKGGGNISKNTLFSTDILFVTIGIGEGPIYRINPNGPQDIQIQDSAIDDLINMDGDGTIKGAVFGTATAYGTTTQNYLPIFGEASITPQQFASPVSLKYGNVTGIPKSSADSQHTSAWAWDSLRFNFLIDQLFSADSKGNVNPYSVQVRITLWNNDKSIKITTKDASITDKKTDSAYKYSVEIAIPPAYHDSLGYTFTVEKTSQDSSDPKVQDSIKIIGWDEIENTKQAYPRTALIGYAIKATNEHTGGVPTFTSMIKGLLVKVPSNYNQPILSTGEIDWRELETSDTDINGYLYKGYRLQKPGTGTLLTNAPNPQIYIGTWDGTFVYSWTQNPIWILYDILTNQTYGLGIPENNIDKYRFYQIAQYCDACDTTGKFIGVSGLADGSYRNKPNNMYTAVRQNQVGLPSGTPIKERRFITDISLVDQEKGIDVLNKIAATFRAVLVYAGSKITLAVDMPEDYPVMLFNETNIKVGSFQISGVKESEIYTGVDVSYVDPTNHFKRETVRVDTADENKGNDTSDVKNIASLDLAGVTRRSQAMRTAQYQIAASKYQRRNISFTTSTDALSLAPGDVISVATKGTGIAYGFGGKVVANSTIGSTTDSNVVLEHFTVPGLDSSVFTANTNPIALRIVGHTTDRMDLYLLSNTVFSLINTGNVASTYNGVASYDRANVKVLSRFNSSTKTFIDMSTTGFTANIAPTIGDLWSIGEIQNPGNYYSNKSGKLFKVTGLKREPSTEEITVTGVEYISNIYVDSDTFINYAPTAYTDILSPFAPPPSPNFTLKVVPRTTIDGTIVADGIIQAGTEKVNYGQKFQTEYYVSSPTSSTMIGNVTVATPITLRAINSTSLVNGTTAILSGKNGFTTPIGEIQLLCNTVSQGTGTIDLTIEGLSSCFDENFYKNILAVNDGTVVTLKGTNQVILPVNEKTGINGTRNFVGYQSPLTELTQPIVSYNTVSNKITITDSAAGGSTLYSALPTAPFYVTIKQVLAQNYYANNSFYVTGSQLTYIKEGTLSSSTTIDLDIKPRDINFIRFYADGKQKTSSTFTFNKNSTISANSNIQYTATSETAFRIEVDHYTVPALEIGDTVEVSYANVFTVINSSYDTSSSKYNAALTSNSIYRVYLATTPAISLGGYSFINTTLNPTGIISNVSGNSFTFDYDKATYPGIYGTANNRIYSLDIGSSFQRYFASEDGKIPNLPIGITSVRARNKNTLGRFSPFVQQSVLVSTLPIQKVENLSLDESIYIEQLGGAAIRLTISFDAIQGQQVTDNEISYKLTTNDTSATTITDYNTVKVPASGVDSTGRIRFTINNINRGAASSTNAIVARVTPLNKTIRGIEATLTKSIIGKTAKPQNILNFIAGQQNDTITFLWSYARDSSGNLIDLDLQDITIRRLQGTVTATLANFLVADSIVTVSAGSARKSIPIDSYDTYTYLAMTKDTSGNYCEAPIATTLTTTKASRSTTIAAYSEDDSTDVFTSIPNTNAGEYNFPSFANSNTSGISYAYTSKTDNANGSSTGWSVIAGAPTNIKALASATYVTPIRDLGQTVTGKITLYTVASQEIQSTYNDQHDIYLSSVSGISTAANVLVDTSFGGIGKLLGYNNAYITTGRYDSNNKSWMTGPVDGNVWGIWSRGRFTNDVANANTYALIVGLINANAVALGATYYANGKATGTNSIANITTVASSYDIVNFKQYNDYITSTYAGDLGSVTTQTLIRTASANVYYAANGNVNTSVFSTTSDGFVPYEAGSKTFRYVQLKYIINNIKPDQFDFTLDKFRYSIDKEQVIYSNTIVYASAPTTIDLSSAKFINRPVINYAVLDQKDALANPVIVVTTASSNTSISFQLVASKTGTPYAANSTANIMITAIGV